MTELFNIQNLSLGYKNSKKINIILQNLNLKAKKGELIALIGINGSGKSTLIKSILSIIKPIEGNIYISGKDISNINQKEKAKLISFVSTEIINISKFKVRDLIALGRFPHTNWIGKLNEIDKKNISDSIKLLDINNLTDKFLNELSDGERQKVMIARALTQNTDIILLDEPTAFLDLKNKYQLVYSLYQLSKLENKLIIFSTHDINIALKLCDKIWLIDNKTVISETPEDLILNNKFDEIFSADKLLFNKTEFDFDFKYEKKYVVNLQNFSNSEEHFILTKKALLRNSFFIEENSSSVIKIYERNDLFIWTFTEKNIFYSIEDLLNFLKSNFFNNIPIPIKDC